MAYPHAGLEKGMPQFNHGDEELDQGIASPVDCWELVGSGPSSPLPEAKLDASAFEEAMTAACTAGGALHHDYFVCTGSSSAKDVLPLSTVMAEQPNEEEGHSSDKSDAFVPLDSETDVGENCTDSRSIFLMASSEDYTEGIGSMHGTSHMHRDNRTHIEGMHPEDSVLHHSDNLDCMFLDEHFDDIELERCEIQVTNLGMYNGEVTDPNDALLVGNETYNCDSVVHSDDESLHGFESTGIADNYQQLSTSAMAHELESTSHSIWDNSLSMQHATAEGGLTPATLEGVSTESAGQSEGSPVMQHSIINTNNSRHCKVFACASWLWTHVSRWQAQLGFANTIWSMALAAAFMGILVLGRGWQRLQAQNRSLRAQLWAKEKRITQLMFQLMQTKESLAKARRVPVIYAKPALRIPHDHS